MNAFAMLYNIILLSLWSASFKLVIETKAHTQNYTDRKVIIMEIAQVDGWM